MKISAINMHSVTNFQGKKKREKSNNLTASAAGAAMLAMIAATPSEKVQAQYYVPTPITNITVPRSFVLGNEANNTYYYEKSMPIVFNEIDAVGYPDGEISEEEVLNMESYNKALRTGMPITPGEANITANLFRSLSALYNRPGSDPSTIDYSEYRNIMTTYMRSKNVNQFINLFRFWPDPFKIHHHHRPINPPPRTHHNPPPHIHNNQPPRIHHSQPPHIHNNQPPKNHVDRPQPPRPSHNGGRRPDNNHNSRPNRPDGRRR